MNNSDFLHNNIEYFVVLEAYSVQESNNKTVDNLLLYILLYGSKTICITIL